VIFPPAVRPGDRVVIVAPSSPFDRTLVRRGIAFLGDRYRVSFDASLFARAGYLAGSDERRRAELQAALSDPAVRAIVAARGGYGASRFVHDLDLGPFAASPKWLVGFSDLTALHVELAARGFASVHGPTVANVGRSDARARAELTRAIEEPRATRAFHGLRAVASGAATGVLTGGNLTLLHACAAAGKLRLPEGSILFLEDIGEKPFRVDRMLTTLRVGGHFGRVAGVVVGDFTGCEPNPDGVTVADVIRDCVGSLGIPVATGMPCGHEPTRNDALVLGAIASLSVGAEGASLSVG